jgi:hypothetical protein
MPDVFDRIAGRHSGGVAPGARLRMRTTPQYVEVPARSEPARALGSEPGLDGAQPGRPGQERSHGDPRSGRPAVERGAEVPPTTPPEEDASSASDVPGFAREAPGDRAGVRPSTDDRRDLATRHATGSLAVRSRDPLPAAPAAEDGLVDPAATAPRRRAPSSSGTGDETTHGVPPQTEPRGTAVTSAPAPAPAVPSPRTAAPGHRPGSTRVVEPEELLREHVAPALVARGALSVRAAERLAAVGLEPIEVPTGGDVHVHIGRVELRQPAAPVPPAPEPPRTGDRAGDGRVDHADYLTRQRRRWS